MKTTLFLFLAIMIASSLFARIRHVDKYGSPGTYPTIQSAINAAVDGDTVRIWPNIYPEVITINKNILVEGGGILNTVITTTSDSVAVTITNGTLQWVGVSSQSNDGIHIQSAEVRNCLMFGSKGCGIVAIGDLAHITNCVSTGNGYEGFATVTGTTTAINCVAFANSDWGFSAGCSGGQLIARYCVEYNNAGHGYYYNCGGSVLTNIFSVSANPAFAADGSWTISQNSPCKDGGDPTILDPDASRSDVGVYGGTNAPILPYVNGPQNIKLNADGTIQFDLTGKVGY